MIIKKIVEKAASLIIAVIYALTAYFNCPILSIKLNLAFNFFMILMLSLSCIWFSEHLGRFTGHGINKESPGCMVKLVGWIILVLIPLIQIINLWQK